MKFTFVGVDPYIGVAMNNAATSLWERQPQARISLWKSLDLFEAAYRARNFSPRTVAWYKERLTPFFRHLEAQLKR